ncbi:MAG: TonB-dependent receptor [Proteobacteria bacterium]|nr:TonB-dependent receptor [Pseudomonadota bacterium]
MNANLSKIKSVALIIAAGGINLPALAQDNSLIEEIIVTATKIERNMQDIPVAVTAITGQNIQDAGIKDMFDLQTNAPGLIMGQSQTTTTSNFSIRGIGTSSNNFGLESSVGLYVDGVYRSRQNSMINELVDVEAVEILRGPQGTLFGKNTPQGAVNLRTVAPSTEEANAFVELSGGDYGLVRLAAASNFTLSDSTAMRATVFSSQRDGYVSDLTGGSDVLNDRDRFGARLQLAYSNDNNFDMRIIAEYSEIDEACCAAVSRVDSIFANGYTDPLSGVPGGLVPGTDFLMFGLGGTIYSANPYDAATIGLVTAVAQSLGLPGNGTIIGSTPFDEYLVAYNSLPHSTSEDSGLSVELNWDLANDMTVTSITGYRAFDSTDTIDADFTDVPLLNRAQQAQQSSITQELRLSGAIGDRGSFVTGVYYFDQDLDNQKQTNGEPFLGTYVNLAEPDLVALVNGVNAVSAGSGGALPMAATAFPVNSFADDDMRQQHQSWAVFGQVDLPMGEDWLLTVGARYTEEDKDMVGTFVQAAQGPAPDLDAIETHLFYALTGNPLFNPAVLAPTWQPGWGTYLFAPLAPRSDLNETLKDDQVSGTIKLTWFANDSTMFYASYGEGFKSGGTNTDRIDASFNPIFGPETSETIELGMKADFPDQNVRVNLAVYDTQVDGLQANSWTGTGFNLQNAGSADTSGWELETWWVPTETLAFQAYWVRSDAKFESFVNGTCWDAYVFHTGMLDPNSGGDVDAEQCPRTGGRLAYNPEDVFYFSFTKDFRVTDSATAYVRGEYSYYSEILTDGDLDPFTLLDSLSLINARLGVRWDDIGSELVFWGRNLSDERYHAGSFDAPIQPGRMNSYPAEPRTWGVTFRKDF